MVTLTPAAAEEVRRVMDSQKYEEHFVRMGIAGGGCSGLQYFLGFDNEFDNGADVRYQQPAGVTVVTSKKMAPHLDGTIIDFQSDPVRPGFAIENPNYPRGGGCPGCGGH